LAGKLFAVDPTIRAPPRPSTSSPPPATTVCVDTPDVFARFRRAVTDTGLYKDSERLAVKDDRRPVKQSEYLYQGDVYRQDQRADARAGRRRGDLRRPGAQADEIAAQRQQWRDRAAACKAICGSTQESEI
jgi:uncharacterized protein YPO0396